MFIVGAGASCELGLPSNDALRSRLLKIVDLQDDEEHFSNATTEQLIVELCRRHNPKHWGIFFEAYLDAASRISLGLPLATSIDDFLNGRRDDDNASLGPVVRNLGKLAITRAILAEEARSALYPTNRPGDRRIDEFNLEDPDLAASWYLPLVQMLASGHDRGDILDDLFKNVAFIVFNYDRCLEQFLPHAIRARFGVAPDMAAACAATAKIVHPYGQVGWLRWQDRRTEGTIPFGGEPKDVIEIAKEIRTYTESAKEGTLDEVASLVRDADTLVFLGFSFQQENMKLLSVERSNVRRVFATTHGISDANVRILLGDIGNMIDRTLDATAAASEQSRQFYRAYIERGSCRALMDNYRLLLMR